MNFVEIEYEEMKSVAKDYRIILHKPDGKRKYYALKSEECDILSCIEIEYYSDNKIKIHCSFTPEKYRRKGYAYNLWSIITSQNSNKIITVQCNDLSVNIALKLGFQISKTREFKRWNAYYLYKNPSNDSSK